MEKEIKIKVGDKVLLKNRRGSGWSQCGSMDKYMGKIVTVSYIDNDGDFNIEEDNYVKPNLCFGKWYFCIDDIERIMYDDFKLDDLQFADIVTTRNGERYVVGEDNMFGESECYHLDCCRIERVYEKDLKYTHKSFYDNGIDYDIMKVERAGQVIWERFEEKKEPAKEMTIAEISEALGYEVKVVKE